MALMAISRAVSANIQRSVTMSELKHEAKMDDLKQQLTGQAILRSAHHASVVIKAQDQHNAWFNTLSEDRKSDFNTVKAALEAAVARPSSST